MTNKDLESLLIGRYKNLPFESEKIMSQLKDVVFPAIAATETDLSDYTITIKRDTITMYTFALYLTSRPTSFSIIGTIFVKRKKSISENHRLQYKIADFKVILYTNDLIKSIEIAKSQITKGE